MDIVSKSPKQVPLLDATDRIPNHLYDLPNFSQRYSIYFGM